MKKYLIISIAIVFGVNASEIVRVTDGDTMIFNAVKTKNGVEHNIKCRIEGIDTPEKFDSDKLTKFAKKYDISIDRVKESGKEATNYALAFFSNFNSGNKLEVTSDSLDVYKRNLCRVKGNGNDYALKILEDGYAVIYESGKYIKDQDYKLKLIDAQKRAKETKSGLWQNYSDVMEAMSNY